ncbi:MAG: VWA domain-containing protein [Gemmatimonadota bacterium]|nr:VWA domain-containing protein [Gemmatimonadota bacterium]
MSLFAQPSAFALFLVLPALWLLWRHARREREEALHRFGDPALLGQSSHLPVAPRGPRAALRWVALACAVFALARPQVGRQPKPLATTGRDIVIALDLSRSMRVADVGGDRLRVAKRLGWQLASARPGDRIGLVVFGGAGFLALPPTGDLGTFQLFLDAATPDDIGDPASDIAAGLRVAERALRREGTTVGSRAVLLLTDGERNEGSIAPVIELYAKSRLPVFAVGIGTVEGGRVPNDSGATEGPWHLDGIGREVISRLNEGGLDSLTAATGGVYARFDDPRALEQLTLALQKLEARTLAAEPATEPIERYQWPLAAAILCLLLDLILGDRSSRRTAEPPNRRTAQPPNRPIAGSPNRRTAEPFRTPAAILPALLLALLSCSTSQRQVARGQQLYDQGKYLEAYEAYQAVLRQQGGSDVRYNAGNALYRMRQYNEAAKTWRDALTGAPDQLRHETYFNMGNAFVRADEDANALSGYLERAIDAYEEALRLNPADQDAKWNLEIALARRGDPGQDGSPGRGGRADYGRGSNEEGYEGSREAAVGAMAGGGSGGDEGESVEEMDPEQARAMLEAIERQQLSTHEGRRAKSTGQGDRDW